MNLKKLLTLGLLAQVALILFACEDPLQAGLDLRSDDELLKTVYTDAIEVYSETILKDSVNTTGAAVLMAGRLNDPDFGDMNVSAYTKIMLSTDSLSFLDSAGRLPIIDSLVLVLKKTVDYADTTHSQRLMIHRLAEPLDTGKQYHSFDALPVRELLGSADIRSSTDSNNVVRVPLSIDFAKELVSKSGSFELLNQSNFENFFAGIRISATDEGSVYGFEPRDFNSRMILYYHFNETDTASFGRSFYVWYGSDLESAWFNKIDNDLSKTPHLKGLQAGTAISSESTGGKIYLQAGTGLATRLVFPGLPAFDTDKNIMINRAELSVSPDAGLFTGRENETPPATLNFLYADSRAKPAKDSDGNLQYLFVDGSPGTRVSTEYSTSARVYSATDLTVYCSEIMNEKRANDGLILDASLFSSEVRKVILTGGKSSEKPMKLRLWYTVYK